MPQQVSPPPSVSHRARVLLVTLVLALGGPGYSLSAYQEEPAQRDTLQTDTLKTTLILGMGQLDMSVDTSSSHFTQFLWTDARSFGDLVRFKPGVFLRELGRPGSVDQMVFGGIDARATSFMIDGRPMTNPVTGLFNLYEIPLEFVDHIEWRRFERGFVEGPNGSGGTINIVSRQYNTSRPITKIRFMQGPYEHLLTDALFTQNATRSLNVLFGVQRQVSDNRFLNSSYDSWIVRSRLRYNLSDRVNVSLSDLYRTFQLGANNGINVDSTRSLGLDPFNEAEAIVYSNNATETQTTRDVTLSAMALAFDDSLSPTQINIYFTAGTRDYEDPSGLTSGLFDRYAWEVHGASIRQTLQMGFARMHVGGQIERRLADIGPVGIHNTRMSAWYVDAALDLGVARPQFMGRGENNGDGQGFSWGGRVVAEPLTGLRLSGGMARSFRFPTVLEQNWPLYSFSAAPNLVEDHAIVQFSADFTSDYILISADLSRRAIENAILFKIVPTASDVPPVIANVVPDLVIDQFSGTASLKIRPWTVTGGLTWTETREGDRVNAVNPRLILTGEISFQDTLLDGALEARFGIQSRYVKSHIGTRFFPAAGIYAQNTGRSLSTFSSLDVFGVFRIGDAFLTITWENPLDHQFFTVYPYPAMGRNIRVSVNWIFLD